MQKISIRQQLGNPVGNFKEIGNVAIFTRKDERVIIKRRKDIFDLTYQVSIFGKWFNDGFITNQLPLQARNKIYRKLESVTKFEVVGE